MSERVAHYEIVQRVAEGGMGVVYKAVDTRLDRDVALKFLSPSLQASNDDLERFLQEARAISRLNHPNIATIYAVEEDRGERFLAFEYLSGGSLKDKIDEAPGQIPLETALHWAARIGRALAHAHRHGIVHRDVKPANVLLAADGGVKLTDFGVAQVSGGGIGGTSQTAGTAAYMSPEQAQELETDHRSDMYSFGVLLFELLAGEPPFVDEREEVIVYDVVNSDAPSLSEKRADLPPALVSLVNRLLSKDPEQRYPQMEDVVEALEQLVTAPADASRALQPSVAVLPLVDMSPEQDQEYFCDGLTEEAILALSAVQGLRVVSKTSSFRFKGAAYDLEQIGKQLDVDSVLEGSVKKAGDRLRITVQHIRVSDGSHIWSQRYDRTIEDIFAIQDEISQSIAGALRLQFAGDGSAHKRKTSNVVAYNNYLEGLHCLSQRTPIMLDRALRSFRAATDSDPGFAAAFAGLAEAEIVLASCQFPGDDYMAILDKARAAAEKALELDPNIAEAHIAMALVKHRADWDWAAAEREFRRAIELSPNHASARHHYAMYLAIHLRLEEARREIAIARELDPLSPIISTAVGRIFHFSRQYEKAVEQCQKTIEMNPDFSPAHFDLAMSYLACEDFEKAADAIERMYALDKNELRYILMTAFLLSLKGDLEEATEWGNKFKEQAGQHHLSPTLLAMLEMQLGSPDKAIEYMFHAVEVRDAVLVYLQCEPAWDPIRSHPDYPEIIAKLGFPRPHESLPPSI